MQNLDEKEQQRLGNIYNSAGAKYPKNPETEKNVNKLYDVIEKLNSKMIENSRNLCKEEYEDLSNYATINSLGMEIKPNADENKLQGSLEKYQLCVESNNKNLVGELQKFDYDFADLSADLNNCLDGTAVNSKAKSDNEIEKSMFDCFKRFEDIHQKLTFKYTESFSKI